jgi:hypothetical protein
VLEALLKELIENGSNPKAASRAGDAATAALAEAQYVEFTAYLMCALAHQLYTN